MSTIETDVVDNTPHARQRGAWVAAPEREELQQFLDSVNGLAQNASSAAATADSAKADAVTAKTVAVESASTAVTALNETKSVANNVTNASIAVEQAKQTASQAAASAGTSALDANQQALTASQQAAKAKVEADKAIAANAQQQDLMNQHVAAANPHSQYLQDSPRDGQQYVREGGIWKPVSIPQQGIQEAPVDGKQYVRKAAGWSEVIIPAVDITEAPKNGKTYGRKDGAWTEVKSDVAAFLAAVPRCLSFQHLNDSGYVAGQQICLWVADADIALKNNLTGSVGMYILDNLHGSLPSQGSVAIFSNAYGAEQRIGYIYFNTNGTVTFALSADVVIAKGKYLRFVVESLVGVWTISVSLKHFIVGV